MAETIRFQVPLPPVWIRSNNRSHWTRRTGVKQAYSERVLECWRDVSQGRYDRWSVGPSLAQARVTFTWRACHLPDQANVLGNCKALLDILCMAPKTTQPNNTTYLGIIEDDKGVEAIGKIEKVAHRHEEAVLVEIEKR